MEEKMRSHMQRAGHLHGSAVDNRLLDVLMVPAPPLTSNQLFCDMFLSCVVSEIQRHWFKK